MSRPGSKGVLTLRLMASLLLAPLDSGGGSGPWHVCAAMQSTKERGSLDRVRQGPLSMEQEDRHALKRWPVRLTFKFRF